MSLFGQAKSLLAKPSQNKGQSILLLFICYGKKDSICLFIRTLTKFKSFKGDVPFRIRFETDADEADTGVAATSGTTSDPINRGIVGFR